MSVTAGVSDTVIAVRDKLRGKIGQTKVKRYWPGKAPEWGADDGDQDGDIRAALESAFPSRDDRTNIVKGDDRRLRRLAENRLDNNKEEVRVHNIREIARIKRDREDRDAMAKEREEIERVRNMTEEERREWERKNPKQNNGAPKQKWRFMQKYYHKGAFFQDDPDDTAGTAGADGVYTRDYSSPTGEDKMDKTILPKVMQVKHFGRSGRTKWTHLVNEDTTDWNNPWTYNDTLRAKYNSQMAGMKPIAKPKGKKIKDWESR